MIKPTFDLAGSRIINRLGFGAMRIPDELDEAREILERALELDVNFIDTADAYGSSERLIGESLRPFPDDLVIATKGDWDGRVPMAAPSTCRRRARKA